MTDLRADKLLLIDQTRDFHDIHSIVDLGGMWGVHGAYLMHAMNTHHCHGLMIDSTETPEHKPPFDYVQADFCQWLNGNQKFDMALLFDVLLHQTCPMSVLRDVSRLCNTAILISQPCLIHPEPLSINIQFNPLWESYNMLQHDLWAKNNGRPHKWSTAAWAWAQTPTWIQLALTGFGWKIHSTHSTQLDKLWERTSMTFIPYD